MKKVFVFLSMVLALCSIDSTAQEVRGIESRRVIYNGPQYRYSYNWSHDLRSSTEYYGWEFYNRNSIPVSLDIELWYNVDGDKIVQTKSVVLESGEKYIFKFDGQDSTVKHDVTYNGYGIGAYYVKYKAYKLQ